MKLVYYRNIWTKMQVSAFSFLSPYVSTTVKMWTFFYPTGKMHFFHSPMTQKRLKESPSKLKKKKGEKLHLLAKIQMEIFDSKEDFQNKIKEACENKGL